MNKIFSANLYILEDLITGTPDDINNEELEKAANYLSYNLESDVEIKLRNNFKLTFLKFTTSTGELIKHMIQGNKSNEEFQYVVYLFRMLRFKVTNPNVDYNNICNHLSLIIRQYANYLDGNNLFLDTKPEFVKDFINGLEENTIEIYNEGNLNYQILDLDNLFNENERRIMYLLLNDIVLTLRIFFY
jgi:hypothetical protein